MAILIKRPLVKPTVLAKPKPTQVVATKVAPRPIAKAGAKPLASLGGFAKAKQINIQNQKEAEIRKNQPFRFYMKVGETRTIILTDTAKTEDELFFIYEHHYEKNGKWGGVCPCIMDQGVCPACKALGKPGRYQLMLSIIDKLEFTDKNGVKHKSSRKLLPLVTGSILRFERLFKEHGTFRGIVLELNRDTAKSPNTGNDFVFKGKLTEAQLATYKDKAIPVNYAKAFPPVTEAELARQWGGGHVPGSEDTTDAENYEAGEELPF